MINFKKLDGPYSVPIYFQKLPDIVQSVALEWVIFTGSADDQNVGTNGAYHWFEHVPFRGTKRFPGGYGAIKGPFTRYGGGVGAYTNGISTGFWAHVQDKQWKEALEVITDLWSQPLLEDAGIEAERTIIFEEIRQKKSTAKGNAYYQLLNIIWPNHPLGHHTLGTEESLKSITPQQLRKAHKLGYDRSRATFFISGNLTEEEILDYAQKCFAITPDNGLSKRSSSASFGALPALVAGKETVIETDFASSVILVLFPVAAGKTIEELIFLDFVSAMINEGGLASPLYRIVREERKLAYGVGVWNLTYRDGGMFGFSLETKKENIEKVKLAIEDVLKDKEIRSEERFSIVKDAIYSDEKMRPISPQVCNDNAITQLSDWGQVISEEEYNKYIEKIKLEDVIKYFDELTPDKAHTYIFKGNEKS